MAKPTIRQTDIKLSLQSSMIIYVVFLLSILMIVTTYMGIQRESQGIFRTDEVGRGCLGEVLRLKRRKCHFIKGGFGPGHW